MKIQPGDLIRLPRFFTYDLDDDVSEFVKTKGYFSYKKNVLAFLICESKKRPYVKIFLFGKIFWTHKDNILGRKYFKESKHRKMEQKRETKN